MNEDDIFEVLQIPGGQRRPRIVTETFSDTSIKFPVRNVNAVQIKEMGVKRERRGVPQALKHHVLKAPHATFTEIQRLRTSGHKTGKNTSIAMSANSPGGKCVNAATR